MMKLANGALLVLNLALFAVAIYFIASRGYVAGAGFTSTELITILLTALAVLLTALGIFIAVLAVLGYTTIRRAAAERAAKAARDAAKEIAASVAREEVAKKVPGLIAGQMQLVGGADYGEAASGGPTDDDHDDAPDRS